MATFETITESRMNKSQQREETENIPEGAKTLVSTLLESYRPFTGV